MDERGLKAYGDTYCPFLPLVENGHLIKPSPKPCLTSSCQLWDQSEKRCAFVAIAIRLHKLEYTLSMKP